MTETMTREEINIQRFGYYVDVMCRPDLDGVSYNTHTHGISTSFPPNLDLQIVLPIPTPDAMAILEKIASLMREEYLFTEGDHDNILEGFTVRFVLREDEGREVWRVILPDDDGAINIIDMNPVGPYAAQYSNHYDPIDPNGLSLIERVLTEARCAFQYGYTSEDADAVLSKIREVIAEPIVVLWDFIDGDGTGGDSELAILSNRQLCKIPDTLYTWLSFPDDGGTFSQCAKGFILSPHEANLSEYTKITEHNYVREDRR